MKYKYEYEEWMTETTEQKKCSKQEKSDWMTDFNNNHVHYYYYIWIQNILCFGVVGI